MSPGKIKALLGGDVPCSRETVPLQETGSTPSQSTTLLTMPDDPGTLPGKDFCVFIPIHCHLPESAQKVLVYSYLLQDHMQ